MALLRMLSISLLRNGQKYESLWILMAAENCCNKSLVYWDWLMQNSKLKVLLTCQRLLC